MYELEALLSLVVAWSYVEGILRGRRAWTPVFVVSTALLAYSHNWGLLLCVGLGAATVAFARDRLRLFGVAAVGIAVLYAPWVPTLLSQARTRALRGRPVRASTISFSAGIVIGGDAPYVALVLVGGAALGGLVVHQRTRERRAIAALLTVIAVTVVVAFVTSQISPAWTARYFAVIFGPVVIVAGQAIARARGLGVATLVALVFLFAGFSVKNDKENAKGITAGTSPYLKTGDLIISTHPEQVPVLRYYLGPGYRWATTLGPMADPPDVMRIGEADNADAVLFRPLDAEIHRLLGNHLAVARAAVDYDHGFRATIAPGARRGRSSWRKGFRLVVAARARSPAFSSSHTSAATRSRSRRTTSSRSRRLSTAESGSKGTIATGASRLLPQW